MEKIPFDDVGTSLVAAMREDGTAQDISTATSVAMILKKPDGTEVEKTAAFESDGIDGNVEYVTVSGDIDQIGIWSYRGKVTFSATQIFHGVVPTLFEVVK